ncbi:MAG: translation initiation factor eIF-2B subunit [Patescibacteria group bacterium]
MSLRKTYQQIKNLKIQGATAVAVAVIKELRAEGLKPTAGDYFEWWQNLFKASSFLLTSRPTEPMAQNLSRLLLATLQQANEVKSGQRLLRQSADDILNLIKLGQENIIRSGQKLIKNGDYIFTHCHSSTVERILVDAQKDGKKIKVFNTETRPLFQGRITAKNLLKQGIDVTMVADSAAGFLIAEESGKDILMDKVLIGADVVISNGAAINKIGSFNIALAAAANNVPVYIVAHLLKTDDDGIVYIEKRADREIWPSAPKKLKILNFAFDLVPAHYITGLVTEFGILTPAEVKKVVKQNYPWLLRK